MLSILSVSVILGWCIYSLCFQTYRIIRGIDITDEAFYTAEVISVIRGNIPYALNNIVISGQTFLPLLPVYLFSLLNPSLEGIILFSRILFLVFRIGILLGVYFLLRRRHNKLCLAFFLSVLFCTWGGSIIHAMSYDTVPFYLNLLTGAILLSAFEQDNGKRITASAVISGILICLAVLAHEADAPNAILFGLMILLFCPRNRVRNMLVFYVSGIGTVLLTMLVLTFCAGWDRLGYGFETLWFFKAVRSAKPFSELFALFQERYDSELTGLYIMAGATVLNGVTVRRLVRNEKAKQVSEHLIPTVTVVLVCCGANAAYQEWLGRVLNEHLGMIICAANLVLLLDAVLWKKKETARILALLFIPYLAWFIPTGFFTYSGPFHRTGYFWLSLMGTMLVYEKVLTGKSIAVLPARIVLPVLLVCTALLSFKGLQEYIYRDTRPIEKLNYQVQTGIFKGLYTTEERGKATEELEVYLRANTTEYDRVLCLDTVPAAYLMINGTHCTPSTWDRMQYSYDLDNRDTSDEIMYRYFRTKGEIPTVIVYVDFGRDEQLSIEEEGYPFNRFVNRHYSLAEEKKLNDLYRVKIYRAINSAAVPE